MRVDNHKIDRELVPTHTHTHTVWHCLTLCLWGLPNSLNHPSHHLSSVGQVRKCWLIYLVIKSYPEDSLTKAMNQNSPDLSLWVFHASICKPLFCHVPQTLLSHKDNFQSLHSPRGQNFVKVKGTHNPWDIINCSEVLRKEKETFCFMCS